MSVRAAHSNQACRPAPGGGHRTDEGAHRRLQAARAWPWPTGPETGPDLARTTPTAAGRRPTSIAAGPPPPRRARLLRFPTAPPSSADERRRPACSLGGANPARISPAAARPCCPPAFDGPGAADGGGDQGRSLSVVSARVPSASGAARAERPGRKS
jgi:hypothetical protein